MIGALLAGSTALNVGGSIFGGLFGASAERKRAAAIKAAGAEASKSIIDAANLGAEKIGSYNDKARGDLSPFREFGVSAGNTLTDLLFGGGDVQNFLKASPLFNFQSELGSRNINRELAARGLYGSGAGLETLARFNNQLVGEEGQRTFDRLFGLTQLGQGAATNMAGLTNQAGISIGDILYGGGLNAAQTKYNAAVGAAAAQANAGHMIANIGQSIFGNLSQGLQGFAGYQMNQPLLESAINANNAFAAKNGMGGSSGGSGNYMDAYNWKIPGMTGG